MIMHEPTTAYLERHGGVVAPEAIPGATSKQFYNRTNEIPWLSYDEHAQIFSQLADADAIQAKSAANMSPLSEFEHAALEDAAIARHRLIASFIGLSASEAFRRDYPDLLDDLKQTAFLGLIAATDSFARLPLEKQGYFVAYAQAAIKFRLNEEIVRQRYLSNINMHQIRAALAFRDTKEELAGKLGRTPSIQEIADALNTSREATFDSVSLLSYRPKYLESNDWSRLDIGEQDWNGETLPTAEQEAKSIIIERALLLLLPQDAAITNLFFGLDGKPPMNYPEIMESLKLSEGRVRDCIRSACRTLEIILPQIESGTFDYRAWQKEHWQSPRNVLYFLASIQIPMPLQLKLIDLRALARQHIRSAVDNEVLGSREAVILQDLYALNDAGQTFSDDQLIKKWNCGASTPKMIYDKAVTYFTNRGENNDDTMLPYDSGELEFVQETTIEDQILFSKEDSIEAARKAVFIERALLLMPPKRAEMIRRVYGLDGEEPRTTKEISKETGSREGTINLRLSTGRNMLEEILPKLEAGTFDYKAWRERAGAGRNVLHFFAVAGLKIPDYKLADLRMIARQYLDKLSKEFTDRQRGMLEDLYGLDDSGQIIGTVDVMKKWRTSTLMIVTLDQILSELALKNSKTPDETSP
ncbi:MAG: hypothetical protein ABWX94_02525 [Candidatus Saccharimonadales bacterium]